jgi:hypothetical protein
MQPLEKALDELATYGVLLKSDARLPSVTTLVAGEPVRGSWWGHPKSHLMFRTLEDLADSADATLVKLISGKDTFVHKTLFAHLIAVGSAREGWQTDGLSTPARLLLNAVDRDGFVRTEILRLPGLSSSKGIGEAARELEAVLLVRGESVHTSTGKHAKCLESWGQWAERIGVGERISPRDAKQEFERTVESLNREFQAKATLPWTATAKLRG